MVVMKRDQPKAGLFICINVLFYTLGYAIIKTSASQ